MKILLFLPVIIGLISILSFLPQDAHAISYDITNQAACLSIPNTGSTVWSAGNSTCIVHQINLKLASSDSFTVENGITLEVRGGNITNQGTITFRSPSVVNALGCTLVNKAGGMIINNNNSNFVAC